MIFFIIVWLLFHSFIDFLINFVHYRMWDNIESHSQVFTLLSKSSKASLEDEFMQLNCQSSIEGLKDCKRV